MDLISVAVSLLLCFIWIDLRAGTVNVQPLRCPERCVCASDALSEGFLVVTCKWDHIDVGHSPFADFSQNTTKSLSVECDGDSPSEFTNDIFADFSSLLSLRIQRCSTRLLPKNIFRGLANLRSLQLRKMAYGNLSLTISEGVFDGLLRLEKLSIVESHIEKLPSDALCNASNLQVVNMSYNWLPSASIGLSPRCPAQQLVIVDISWNNIHSIGSADFAPLLAIRQLSLAHNHIEHIHREAFQSTALLQQLLLEDNRIQELPYLPETLIHMNVAANRLNIIAGSVARLPNLTSLNVSANNIDTSSPFPLASVQLELLDLSSNRFDSFPHSLLDNCCSHLLHLSLARNRIPQISPNSFQNFTHLQTLDLSSNRLSELEDECFSGLAELTQLYLKNNSIYQIGVAVFDFVSHLLELDLSSNVLLEVPVAIGRLFKLRQLNLSNNQISKTYKFLFNKLPHLVTLDISHNRVPSVDSYVFSDLPRLVELSLSHNSIDFLSQDGFTKCPKLRHLDVSSNFLASFNGALVGLQNLRRLNATANRIEILQWNEFPVSLISLELADNRIALVGSALASRVKIAQLQNNRIMVLSSEQVPAAIERLNVSGNVIQVVSNGTFATKSSLRLLDIRNNRLARLEQPSFSFGEASTSSAPSGGPVQLLVAGNPLVCTCEMDWLKKAPSADKTVFEIADDQQALCSHRISMRKISLAHVSRDELLCSYHQTCEPDCICCQYGNCDCKSKCPDGCDCYHDATYSTNIVRCIALNETDRRNFSPKDLPMYATHVFLEKMNIPIIRSHDFLGRMRLIQLFINSSSVQEVQPLSFNTLPSLQLLDLSGNLLTHITGDEMYRTQKVTHLFLNDNQLRSVDSRIKEVMPSLQLITLHDNNLEDLPEVIEQLGGQLARVSLASNPFRCDCDSRFRMQSWLPANLAKVADASNVYCVENVTSAFRNNDTTVLSAFPPNFGNDIFRMPMAQFIANANTSICNPKASGIFGVEGAHNSMLLISVLVAILLLVVGVILLGVALLRKTHTAMAQRRYKAPPSLNCSQTTPGSSPLPLIHFDAFVSYAKKDEKLVIDFICRQLEYEEYLLCLLHRDGPAYNTRLHSVSDELINQMECSQSLILVLTKQFLESEWKTLQIKTSHQLFAKNRHKRLIAVLGEGIEPNQLDAELGQILRKNTCIRINDPLFWNLLHSALPMRIAPSSCSGDSSQIYSDCYGSIVPSDIV